MTYQEYINLFNKILSSSNPQPPYNNPDYLDYTRLNFQRMNRWMKTLELDEELVQIIKSISEPMHWIVIIEPWCGDVAPTLPFLIKLSEQNPTITYNLQLRDSEPFLINNYLTNGTKSIPQFIVRNKNGNDLFSWGARPAAAQQLMDEMKAQKADINTIRTNLQNWYNNDKGRSLQNELKALFAQIK